MITHLVTAMVFYSYSCRKYSRWQVVKYSNSLFQQRCYYLHMMSKSETVRISYFLVSKLHDYCSCVCSQIKAKCTVHFLVRTNLCSYLKKLSLLATNKLLISVRLLVQYSSMIQQRVLVEWQQSKAIYFCYSSDLLLTTELSFFPTTKIQSSPNIYIAQE